MAKRGRKPGQKGKCSICGAAGFTKATHPEHSNGEKKPKPKPEKGLKKDVDLRGLKYVKELAINFTEEIKEEIKDLKKISLSCPRGADRQKKLDVVSRMILREIDFKRYGSNKQGNLVLKGKVSKFNVDDLDANGDPILNKSIFKNFSQNLYNYQNTTLGEICRVLTLGCSSVTFFTISEERVPYHSKSGKEKRALENAFNKQVSHYPEMSAHLNIFKKKIKINCFYVWIMSDGEIKVHLKEN